MKISATVVTYNEEKNINKCLKSLSFADEIVMIDSNSTDNTVGIAKKYTKKIFFMKFRDFSQIKNYAMSKTKYDWLLSIDADEEVSPELKDKILMTIKGKNTFDGYYIKRETIFLGRKIKHCGWGNDYQLRLFKKNKGAFDEKPVHESIKVNGITGKINKPITHNSYLDSFTYFKKMNRYTSLQAEEKQKKFLLARIIFSPLFKFLRMYFFKLGFLDGLQGFILSIYSSFSEYAKFAKMFEKRKSPALVDKLIVRMPNWLGDAVIATAFLEEAKKLYKKIYVLADESVAELYNNNHFVDELIIFNKKSFIDSFKIILRIRKEKIKTGISLTPSLSSGFILWFGGVSILAGFCEDGLFLNRRYCRDKKHDKLHIAEEYKRIFYEISNRFDFKILKQLIQINSLNEKETSKKFCVMNSSYNIIIAPFAAYGPAKMWPLENYVELIKNLVKLNNKIRIYIVGSEKDKKFTLKIPQDNGIFDLRGKTTLGQVCGLIKNMDLFIGNDSGLMHIADAFHIPLIAIFGSTSAKWTGPLSKNAYIFGSGIDCSPCFEKVCKFGHYKCLYEIKPETVLSYAKKIITKHKRIK